MRHFTLLQLSDLVRGFRPSETSDVPDSHLIECAECARSADFLHRAAQSAIADRRSEPPRNVVMAAERIFPVMDVPGGLRRLIGRLSFDRPARALPSALPFPPTHSPSLLFHS